MISGVVSIALTHLIPSDVRQDWETLTYDQSLTRKPLKVGPRTFRSGLGTHANFSATYTLGRQYQRFQSWVGLDASAPPDRDPRVEFEVRLDGQTVYRSGEMSRTTEARRVDLDVSKATVMELKVNAVGADRYGEHATWGEPRLQRTVGSNATILDEGPEFQLGRNVRIFATLQGATRTSPVVTRAGRDRVSFQYDVQVGPIYRARVEQSFTRRKGRILGEVVIRGKGRPWSAPLITRLTFPKGRSVWVPVGRGFEWNDPLEFWPARNEFFPYGKRFDKSLGAALPVGAVALGNRAVVLSASPLDPILDAQIVTEGNSLAISRTRLRFESGRPQRFRFVVHDTEAHALDVLRAVADEYPEYFEPNVQIEAGLGSYSATEEPLDEARFHRMGFALNWKASFDFSYLGMFLPPLDPETPWNRFPGNSAGEYTAEDAGRKGQTTLRQMEAYNQQMRRQGFGVLSYFNVTEFGGNIEDHPVTREAHLAKPHLEDSDWEDPQSFLFRRFPNAILRDPNPTFTWGRAVVTDCGDPDYQAFLLEQADRHLQELPSANGICIDRMDWLDRVNPRADDGVTWIEAPARSLTQSWNRFLAELAPRFHRRGKVVFANPLIHRLDLMRHLDGVYDEYGNVGGNLNASAFLCLYKPLLAWTPDENALRPNPDAYFQRHLYMGAFPTVPMPQNDHSILPSEWADPHYLAYGPLFSALKGRRWLLDSGFVSADGAKVNAFRVAEGIVVPVVFGGDRTQVRVRAQVPPATAVEIIHPGEERWAPLEWSSEGVDVPLRQGCAVLRLRLRSRGPALGVK